jgi:hypothetical protein
MRGEYPGASLWSDEAVNNFLLLDKGSCIESGDSIFVKLRLGFVRAVVVFGLSDVHFTTFDCWFGNQKQRRYCLSLAG